MSIKIEKKIVSYSVVDKTDEQKDEKKEIPAEVVQIGEPLARPDKITGSTYKVKTPVTEHALYITINDVIMNEGTDQEHRRPFEIFVNSKILMSEYFLKFSLTRSKITTVSFIEYPTMVKTAAIIDKLISRLNKENTPNVTITS